MATTFAPIEYIDSVNEILLLISPYLKNNNQAKILYKIMENLKDILITLGIEEISLGNEGKRENIFLIPSSDPLGRKVLIEEAKRNALAALTPFGISNPTPAMLIGKTFNTVGIDLGIYLSFINTIPLIEITLSSEVLIEAIGLVAIENSLSKISQQISPKKINKKTIIHFISEYQSKTHSDNELIQSVIIDNPKQRVLTLFTVKKTVQEYKKMLLEESNGRTNKQLQLELSSISKLIGSFFLNSDITESTIRCYRTLFVVERVILALEKEIAILCSNNNASFSSIQSLMIEHDTLALAYLDSFRFVKTTTEMLYEMMQLNRTIKSSMPYLSFDENGTLLGIEKSIIELDLNNNFLSASQLRSRLNSKNKEYISFMNVKIGPYSDDIILNIFRDNRSLFESYKNQRNTTVRSLMSIVTPSALKNIRTSSLLVSTFAGLPNAIITEGIESHNESDNSISDFMNNFTLDFIEENTQSELEELQSEPWYRSLLNIIMDKVLKMTSFAPKCAVMFNMFFLYNASIMFPDKVIVTLLNRTSEREYRLLREIQANSETIFNGQQYSLAELNAVITDISSEESLEKEFSGIDDVSSRAPLIALIVGGIAAIAYVRIKKNKSR